jgi:hypothetical protein
LGCGARIKFAVVLFSPGVCYRGGFFEICKISKVNISAAVPTARVPLSAPTIPRNAPMSGGVVPWEGCVA